MSFIIVINVVFMRAQVDNEKQCDSVLPQNKTSVKHCLSYTTYH